jgi:hypothetical protein
VFDAQSGGWIDGAARLRSSTPCTLRIASRQTPRESDFSSRGLMCSIIVEQDLPDRPGRTTCESVELSAGEPSAAVRLWSADAPVRVRWRRYGDAGDLDIGSVTPIVRSGVELLVQFPY